MINVAGFLYIESLTMKRMKACAGNPIKAYFKEVSKIIFNIHFFQFFQFIYDFIFIFPIIRHHCWNPILLFYFYVIRKKQGKIIMIASCIL